MLTRVDEGEKMDEAKRKRLAEAGWVTGTAAEFLGLTKEEEAIVEARFEHQRLRLAAVEAAKAERVAAKEYEAHLISKNWHRSVETRVAREKAVDTLIAFEAEHGIGSKQHD